MTAFLCMYGISGLHYNKSEINMKLYFKHIKRYRGNFETNRGSAANIYDILHPRTFTVLFWAFAYLY